MQTFRYLAFIFLCAVAVVGPAALANTFCVPPKPAPPPPPQEPPCNECEPKECNKCTKSPVYVGAGTYVRDDTDLTIRTTGLGISAARHYDSSRSVDGPVGIGWTSSLTPRIYYTMYTTAPQVYGYTAYVVMPNGSLRAFAQETFHTAADNSFSPPNGVKDQLVKHANGTYTVTGDGGAPVLRFHDDGTIDWMKDAFGNTIDYTYDASGRLQRVADNAGSGRYVDVTWNPAGRISELTDSAARTIRYTYDADGTLTGVANAVTPSGQQSTNYTYVTGRFAPLLHEVKDRWLRLITRIGWDAGDRVASYTDGDYDENNPATAAGEKYTYTYNPNGVGTDIRPQTTKTDSLGSRTYVYSPSTGLVVNDGTEYDTHGRVKRIKDDEGHVTVFTYDSSGRLIMESVYDREPQPSTVPTVVWTYTYDATFPDKVSTRKSNKPSVWRGYHYEYHAAGSGYPAGTLWKVYQYRTGGATKDLIAAYLYDSKGRSTQVSVPDQPPTIYQYDAKGDLTGILRNGFGDIAYTYDSLGRILTATDEEGSVTSYTWDAADRLGTVTQPKPLATSSLNFTTSYEYDVWDAATGLVFTETTDPNGRVTKAGYDALGRLVRSIDVRGYATAYAYRHGLLSSTTDANGNVTQYAYGEFRYPESVTHPDGAVETTEYSQRGVLRSATDRLGIKRKFNYDEHGRMTYVQYMNQSWPGGMAKGIRYNYDGDKLTSIGDQLQSATASYEYTYDSSFRVVTEGYVGGPVISYDYLLTPGDALESYTVTPPTGNTDRTSTVYYDYDSGGRVRSLAFDLVTDEVTFDYNERGQYEKLTFANGMTREYTYDGQGRLTKVANVHLSTGNIGTFEYRYDTNWESTSSSMLGQRDRVIVTSNVQDGATPGTTKYRYDADYQLIGTDHPNGIMDRWTYDGIGNRVTASTGANTVTYHYYKQAGNSGNSSRLRDLSNSSTVYTYDANGNRLNNATWDIAGRLTSYAGKTFNYAWDGRRTQRGTTTYVHQGLHAVRERDTTAPAVLNDYIFGPGIDEPLVRKDIAGNKTYFVVDGLGSVIARVNSAGAVVESNWYDPWGKGDQPAIGYTAREVGAQGTLYYRARYYEPATGRFLSEDPIVTFTTPYAYADNDPVLRLDPMGLASSTKDKLWCLSSGGICGKMLRCKHDAEEATLKKFGKHTDGTPSNAFKHCYYACCLASNLPLGVGKKIADGHEDIPGNLICQKDMDLFNNKQGAAGAGGDCTKHCSTVPLQHYPKGADCIPCDY